MPTVEAIPNEQVLQQQSSNNETNQFKPKMLLLLSLGHLITDIYQGALPAVLPFLKDHLSLSYAMTGVILMAANFTSSLVQPLFGFLSDRGKKPFLLPLGCLVAGLGFSFLFVSDRYEWILALVVVSGLGAASYHPEGFKTAHFFTGARRATGIAIFSVGGNLGFAIGPLLAISIIQYLSPKAMPIIIVPSLCFAVLIAFSWRAIAHPAAIPAEQKKAQADGSVKTKWLPLSLIIAVVIARSWIQMGLLSYIPFYYINYLHGDALYAGKLVTLFLLGGAVGTLAGAPVADRWGHKRFLVWSMFLSALIFPLIFAVNGILLFLVLGVLGFVVVSTFSVTIVMAQHLMPGHLGVVSGLIVGFAVGAGGICVTLLGVLADHFGVPLALQSIAVLPILGFFLSILIPYPESSAATVKAGR